MRLFNPRKLTLLVALGILLFAPLVYSQGVFVFSATTDKAQYAPGETATISGKVLDGQNNPVLAAGVSIQVNDPQGAAVHVRLTYSNQFGAYSDSFVLPLNSVQGEYIVYISASKPGFKSAQTKLQFSVIASTTHSAQTPTTSQMQPSKCFIATATYGSELSPEVALLRNFRDANILQTSAGRSFMLAFNAFYYSFSPEVSSFIATNNHLRATMRILLYPLIVILYIASSIFAMSSFNQEFAVVMSGIFAASAIGFVYLGPIATAATSFAKCRDMRGKRVGPQMILVSCTVSLLALTVAEFYGLNMLLPAATAATVLSFLLLGGSAVPYMIRTVHKPRPGATRLSV